MRVLVVPSWYPTHEQPMNGSFFREQAQMMAASGCTVSVLSPRLVRGAAWRGPRPVVEQDGAVRTVRFDVPALPQALQGAERELLRRGALAAFRALGAEVPDVIHAHSVHPGIVVAKELGLEWDRPFVLTEHRPSSLTSPRTAARRREIARAVSQAAKVATVSGPFAQEIGAHYGREDVEVVDLPVPQDFLTSTLPAAGDDDGYTFLHVSHLDPNKRAAETIAAFARSGAARHGRLVIVGGNGERVAALRTVAREAGVADRVELRGPVSRRDLPAVMAEANCLVLASAVEAGGTVISEAKASGMAVIATRTWGGLHGVDESAGALVDVDDPAQLESALARAAEEGWAVSPASRERIRGAALARYSQEAFVARQGRIYEDAVAHGDRPAMIFHAPYPIDPNPTSASRLRPKRMLESFRAAGLRVHEVTGDPRDRAAGYRDARRLQRAGRTFELLYSENSTQPNVLATSIRRGVAPLLDARILAWAHRSRIPAGEFYRDIYWRFSTKLTEVRTPRSLLMQLAYRFDLEVLRRTGTHVFLPSLAMGPELPYPRDRFSALPPGTDVRESPTPSGVHLFYVGGLGADYGLHACVEAVSATPGVSLTLCVPERDWTANAAAYQGYLSDRIRVVHATSRELAPYYAQASACVLFVEPTPYRRFAAPVKFFEYLGYGKPILLSEGTLAGDMGAELGIGIPIAYTAEAFAAALSELQEDPQRLPALARRAEEVRSAHTWQARVQEAISVLRPELTEKLADHQPLSR